ncbi:hypothetical protein CEXT_193751 [Caerostris extrusa]|uniref:Uncharacterized protein n=1 Tax=Caerostris extrusa TaxID=172846 RepID=A0AAV4XR14_CAEEX|nr:hypothetical protein CEXT_193751 [Caerostris extrusa]
MNRLGESNTLFKSLRNPENWLRCVRLLDIGKEVLSELGTKGSGQWRSNHFAEAIPSLIENLGYLQLFTEMKNKFPTSSMSPALLMNNGFAAGE